jgi:hypothetical protein
MVSALPRHLEVATLMSLLLVLWLRVEWIRVRVNTRWHWTLFMWGCSWAFFAVVDWLSGYPADAIVLGYSAAIALWLWWKSGGGDQMRRLAAKVASMVAVAGSRLAVVPAPAGA